MPKTQRSPGSDQDDQPTAKRARPCLSILDFSDELLVMIVQHIECLSDLLCLSQTCDRFHRICRDKSFWINVDARQGSPLTLRQLRRLFNYLHQDTETIAIKGFLSQGNNQVKESISPSFLETLSSRCPKLKELCLEQCYIDASKTPVTDLPRSLTTLRLRGCEVVNIGDKSSFFTNLHHTTPHLRILDLQGSGWLSNHSLMAICKCEELKELNLRKCFRIGECFVYSALACRFGFRQLEKIDLRDTGIGSSDVACFARIPLLKTLYMGFSVKTSESKENIDDKGNVNMAFQTLTESFVTFSSSFSSRLALSHHLWT